MAQCPTDINAISVLFANRRSRKVLIVCTIALYVNPEQIRQVLQAHSEGSSLRGISRITGLAYNTVVSLVRAASQKAQLVHNAEVQSVETEEVSADELWSFVSKNRNSIAPKLERSEIAGLG